VVSGLVAGTAVITASAGSVSDTITVTVSAPVPATGVSITQGATAAVGVGGKITLTATVSPPGSTATVTWSSSDYAKASVNAANGEVLGVAEGTAVITARAGSATATITVTVQARVPATGVTITEGTTANVAIGATITLHTMVAPDDSTDAVTWSSNNTAVATVDAASGVVSGVAEGSTVITARAGSVSDTITVTVKDPSALPAITWTAVADRIGDYDIVNIAYGGGRFVAVNARGYVYYSDDGVTWTQAPDKFSFGGDQQEPTLVWGGMEGAEKFVTHIVTPTDGAIFYSTNGVNWEISPSRYYTEVYDIAWGGTGGAGKFVAVGGRDVNGRGIAYSADGITWTKVDGELGFYVYVRDIVRGGAAGAEKFVGVAGLGKMAYSADGVTWTEISETDTTFFYESGSNIVGVAINGIAYGNGKFVAVGGRIAYSNDQE
jgi:hypothetical protein